MTSTTVAAWKKCSITWACLPETDYRMGLFAFLKKWLGGNRQEVMEMLTKGAVVLDVRTAAEYRSGHVPGSVHIPLDQIGGAMERLRKMQKPIVACCATGRRSGVATDMIRRAGMACINGGAWTSVQQCLRAVKAAS